MSLVVEVVCDPTEADAGFVGERLTSHHDAELRYLTRDQLVAGQRPQGDLLVLLGSARSVRDPKDANRVAVEAELVARSLAAGVPVLGICYGAQLLAQSYGGTVHDAATPEVGWYDVESFDERLCPPVSWAQCHDEAFEPPAEARVLGRSAAGCQAFTQEVSGTRLLAWQFHPEVTATRFAQWVESRRHPFERAPHNADALIAEAPRLEAVLRDAAYHLTDDAVGWLLDNRVDDGPDSLASAEALSRDLTARGVEVVALHFVDNAGVVRTKAVPLRRLAEIAHCGISAPTAIEYFTANDQIAPAPNRNSSLRDIRLLPDLSRVTVLEAQPGWALVPADRVNQDLTSHFSCGRRLLRRMVARLDAIGVQVLAAFEVEWMVSVGQSDDFTPPTGHAAYGLSSLIELSDYGRDLVVALEKQGVGVEQFHPEFAVGQFEVSVRATEPLLACDITTLVRATIRAVGVRHGVRTTFAPKPVLDSLGNGGHVHLSLWRDDVSLMTIHHDQELSSLAGAFTAGVLIHLPSLAALGAPSPASYLRLVPNSTAGIYACWGWENREAAIRMIPGSAGGGKGANLELKCFDQLANPYLLLAGVLAAGLDGIGRDLVLPAETTVNPADLSDDHRDEAGIRKLPADLDESLTAFEGDDLYTAVLGPDLVEQILAVRRHDAEYFRDKAPQEIAAAARWAG